MTAVDTPVAAPPTGTAAPNDLSSRFVGRKYVQLVLVLGAMSAIGPLTVDTYLPALPELSRQLGATDSQAQATITGLLIGLGLGQLIIGPLSDAVGRRRPLLAGLGLHALMSVLCALAPSIGMLTATRTLQGFAGCKFNFEYSSPDKSLLFHHWQDKGTNGVSEKLTGDIATS